MQRNAGKPRGAVTETHGGHTHASERVGDFLTRQAPVS